MSGSVMKIATPIIAAVAVWAANEGLKGGYRASTGQQPPEAEDLNAPMGRVLLFSVASAALGATVHVAISRGIAKMSAKDDDYAELA